MNYVTVFDLEQAGFTEWPWLALLLALLFVSAVPVVLPWTRLWRWFSHLPREGLIIAGVFCWLFFLFMLVVTGLVTFFQLGGYLRDRNGLRNGTAQVVEGPVENFKPMPYTGHQEEWLTVQGVRFHYSDFDVSPAFHTTEAHGGPVHAGTQVRIHYVGNDIVKLEIGKP